MPCHQFVANLLLRLRLLLLLFLQRKLPLLLRLGRLLQLLRLHQEVNVTEMIHFIATTAKNLSLLVLCLGIPCPIDSSQLLLFLLQLRRGLHGGRGQGCRFCSGWCGCGGRVGRRNARISDTSVVLRRFSLRKNASLHFITSKLTEYFGSKRLQFFLE